MAEAAVAFEGTVAPRAEPVGTPAAAGVARRSTEAGIDYVLIRDRAGFDALEAEWNELFARCGKAHHVFQTFAWNWYWTRAFLGETETRAAPRCPIAVLVARRQGRIVALWPMAVTHRAGLVELTWMGEPVSQYGDILIDDAIADRTALLRDGWQRLCRDLRPDVVRLRKVRADANITPLLDALGTLHTAELEAPYIDLTKAADFAAYEERFPNRARRNRRRQMRRLQELGTVAVRHLEEGREASRLADVGIEMKRAWLIDRGHVSPALADTRMARFMAAIASGEPFSAGTRVSVLTAGDQPAAIQIGFEACKTRALHVIAYDRRYEKMAAGVLHLEESIRHAFEEGLERIDLLAPKADYKVDWADGTVAVTDHALGLSARGRLYARVYLGYVRQRLKDAVERLPHGVRRRLVASHLKTAAKRVVAVLGFG